MINYQRCKDKIDAILNSNSDIAIDIDTNEITTCGRLACIRCLFSSNNNNGSTSCYRNLIKWLVAEYVEVDWSKVPIDTPVLVSNNGENWYRRYFAGVDDEGKSFVFPDGTTSWSNARSGCMRTSHKYIELAEVE